jgi:hypothetical protein
MPTLTEMPEQRSRRSKMKNAQSVFVIGVAAVEMASALGARYAVQNQNEQAAALDEERHPDGVESLSAEDQFGVKCC